MPIIQCHPYQYDALTGDNVYMNEIYYQKMTRETKVIRNNQFLSAFLSAYLKLNANKILDSSS